MESSRSTYSCASATSSHVTKHSARKSKSLKEVDSPASKAELCPAALQLLKHFRSVSWLSHARAANLQMRAYLCQSFTNKSPRRTGANNQNNAKPLILVGPPPSPSRTRERVSCDGCPGISVPPRAVTDCRLFKRNAFNELSQGADQDEPTPRSELMSNPRRVDAGVLKLETRRLMDCDVQRCSPHTCKVCAIAYEAFTNFQACAGGPALQEPAGPSLHRQEHLQINVNENRVRLNQSYA